MIWTIMDPYLVVKTDFHLYPALQPLFSALQASLVAFTGCFLPCPQMSWLLSREPIHSSLPVFGHFLPPLQTKNVHHPKIGTVLFYQAPHPPSPPLILPGFLPPKSAASRAPYQALPCQALAAAQPCQAFPLVDRSSGSGPYFC